MEASALLEAERRALEAASRMEKELARVAEYYSAEMAKVIADRTRERREWGEERARLCRRVEELREDLGRAQARQAAAEATVERLSVRRARVEGAANEFLRSWREEDRRCEEDAAHVLSRVLRE